MAIAVSNLSFGYPGGETLFVEVSFRVDTGMHAGLVGDNATGKSSLLKVLAGFLEADDGVIALDGRIGYMPQTIGQRDEPVSVREFLSELSGVDVSEAAHRLWEAEHANTTAPSEETGMALAAALEAWSDVHGFEVEAAWDAACTSVLRQTFLEAADRLITELSGGERKRLAIEMLLESDAEVLLLDEPDNFLDVPAKRRLEQRIRRSSKTILVISHDRELLSNAIDRIITLEGSGVWVHGGSFAGYPEAREARNAQLGGALDRWKDEERRLFRFYKTMKQRASVSDANAARARAAETRWNRFVDAGPPPAPPSEQRVSVQLTGADSGKRVIRCVDLSIADLSDPFSVEVHAGDRVAVIGANGSGKSHFVRLLGGETIDHEGSYTLGARVKAGLFVQTNDPPDLVGRSPMDALRPGGGSEENIMKQLGRYGLAGAARLRYEQLSGGQQARLQVLSLERGGANLLLLDEPTDNLDLVSAESLQKALASFNGTVVAVTHDRWFLRGFDRYLLFRLDGSVGEVYDSEAAIAMLGDHDLDPGPASFALLTEAR